VRGVSDDTDILRTQLYTEHLRLRQTIAATTSSVETLQRELKSVCPNEKFDVVAFARPPLSPFRLCGSSMLDTLQRSESSSSNSSEVARRVAACTVTNHM
jgi:hypothetical protein